MGKRRLLLIDSDSAFREFLHAQLAPYDFAIDVADRSNDLLASIEATRPELIFIAMERDDKFGYALCNKLKKSTLKEIPVVLTTSSVNPKVFEEHRKLPVRADEYFDKRTLTAEELVARCKTLLALGEPREIKEKSSMEKIEKSPLEESVDAELASTSGTFSLVQDEDEDDDSEIDDLLNQFAENADPALDTLDGELPALERAIAETPEPQVSSLLAAEDLASSVENEETTLLTGAGDVLEELDLADSGGLSGPILLEDDEIVEVVEEDEIAEVVEEDEIVEVVEEDEIVEVVEEDEEFGRSSADLAIDEKFDVSENESVVALENGSFVEDGGKLGRLNVVSAKATNQASALAGKSPDSSGARGSDMVSDIHVDQAIKLIEGDDNIDEIATPEEPAADEVGGDEFEVDLSTETEGKIHSLEMLDLDAMDSSEGEEISGLGKGNVGATPSENQVLAQPLEVAQDRAEKLGKTESETEKRRIELEDEAEEMIRLGTELANVKEELALRDKMISALRAEKDAGVTSLKEHQARAEEYNRAVQVRLDSASAEVKLTKSNSAKAVEKLEGEVAALKEKAAARAAEAESALREARVELASVNKKLSELQSTKQTSDKATQERENAVKQIAELKKQAETDQASLSEMRDKLQHTASELETLRSEQQTIKDSNRKYQEQLVKAVQQIKIYKSTVAKAKKAMAVAFTLLDGKKVTTATRASDSD